MMFSIRWMPVAFEQMAKIIRNHSSEKEVFAIILQALAKTLAIHPGAVGESRSPNNRMVFWGQLSFVYRILEVENRVEILSVVHSERA